MRTKSIFFTLSVLLVTLAICTCFLYRQNEDFRRTNHTLLLQNDSIQSVNQKLAQVLDSSQNLASSSE